MSEIEAGLREALLLAVEEVDNAWTNTDDPAQIEYGDELPDRLDALRKAYCAYDAASPVPSALLDLRAPETVERVAKALHLRTGLCLRNNDPYCYACNDLAYIAVHRLLTELEAPKPEGGAALAVAHARIVSDPGRGPDWDTLFDWHRDETNPAKTVAALRAILAEAARPSKEEPTRG